MQQKQQEKIKHSKQKSEFLIEKCPNPSDHVVKENGDFFAMSLDDLKSFKPIKITDNKIDTLYLFFDNDYSVNIYAQNNIAKKALKKIKQEIQNDFIENNRSWQDILNFLEQKFNILGIFKDTEKVYKKIKADKS